MTKTIFPASLLCDFYKVSHREQYPEGTEAIYSTWIPRSNKYFPMADEVVTFGIQSFIKKYLIDYFNVHFFNRSKQEVVDEYIRYMKHTLLVENPDASHIADLHDLGYLPIRVKAVKEGTLVPIKVPMLTIENTNSKFFWVTNYLETIISNEIWQPMTSATIAYTYRKLLDEFAIKTTGSNEGVIFQGHDFSMRGMGAFEASASSGAGHLLSFVGTDTIPAIAYHEHYYNTNIENELVGTSIPATEHSVMCAYGETDEFELFKHLMTNVYPSGFFSVVSDTWDFWKVVSEYLPKLKETVLARDGRVVIRPDSGDPVEILVGKQLFNGEPIQIGIDSTILDEVLDDTEMWINPIKYGEKLYDSIRDIVWDKWYDSKVHDLDYGDDYFIFNVKSEDGKLYQVEASIESYERHECVIMDEFTVSIDELNVGGLEYKGLIECLWDIFGGTVTEQGYKVLNPKIGAIYGDSITIERAKAILEGLERKGFASTNIVFGIGSFTYQHNTRDTFGFAMKATWAKVNGEERLLFKDPKTDDGTKKSLKGRVHVGENNGKIIAVDGMFEGESLRSINLLETVFEDGKLLRDQSLSEIREILHKGKF